MEEDLQFYRTPGHYTDPKKFRSFLQSLPDSLEEIVRFIKTILIHPIQARNDDVKFNYRKVLRSQLDFRSIDDILYEPHVSALLSKQTSDLQSSPSQRGIFSCDHHAIVFASILRLKGRPVRARCGYATYLVANMFTPHWICEVYDEPDKKWKFIDPEQAIINLESESFLPAGKIWMALGRGEISLERIVPDYRNGTDEVKYRLLNDMNALMKNELLNYEWMIKEAAPRPPRIFSKPVANLDETERGLVDLLAEISSDEEPQLPMIQAKYQTYIQAENLWSQGTNA